MEICYLWRIIISKSVDYVEGKQKQLNYHQQKIIMERTVMYTYE